MSGTDIAQLAAHGAGAGVWTLVLIALITLIKGWPALRKLSIEADGSLRRDLLDRIDALEKELSAERRSCDDRLREQDSRHKEEIATIHGELNGLRSQMIQLQRSSGTALPLGPLPARATDRTSAEEERLLREIDRKDGAK